MKFRFAAPVALAVALTLAAAGCSGGPTTAAGDDKSFEFWSFTGIDQKAAVQEYRKEHPDVRVKLTEVGSSTETAQALTTALAGGKVPDLVLIQGDDLPKFVQQPQNFHDLREFGADKVKGDYLDWVMSQSTTEDGQIIGVPTDVGGMAVAYRKDLFAEAGLPTDREAVSKLWPDWDAFIETGKKYTKATGKPFVDNAPTSVFYQAVNQVSEKYYDNDDHSPIYAKNPQVKEAFDTTLKAIEAGITAKQSSFSNGWSAGMARGKYAVVAAPSWMLNSIRTTAPGTKGKWDIATIPGGNGNWGGSYLAIPRNAKNPKAAWNYIKATQSPKGQLQHFLDSGSLPTTPSVYEDARLTSMKDEFFSGAPTGQIYTKSLLGLEPFYIGPDSAIIGQEFLNALTDVEQGKGDPAKAWDTAVKNIKTAIGQ
ncbi:extracellular solute-binding protein [Streptomyces himalayensis]|uniref:Extracellular solute-binding protein n=1 Tax=Streptomyces himalayensis subsp. himalayensis TaxID=2756131 RepID=A0A7W0DT74_9ACTN|nr:extracellular solute-binding protein [Streptomyces himalayensis]MBA2950836.1 extracellular solute-binding protein [Streptomyces himalayensis subsp. himalayensis]